MFIMSIVNFFSGITLIFSFLSFMHVTTYNANYKELQELKANDPDIPDNPYYKNPPFSAWITGIVHITLLISMFVFFLSAAILRP